MGLEMILCVSYLVVINLVTFIVFGVDKRRAIMQKWRISERTLLALSAAGGSAGAFAGMRLFRHKIRKPKFYLGVPGIFVLQVILGYVIWG